jgi:putative Mn2+ efflux pump MntP
MLSLETALMGIALAVDAAIVSFAFGLLHQSSHPGLKLYRASVVSMVFGFFQFLMLWLGSVGGYWLTFSSYGYLYQFIVAIIFIMLALRLLQESSSDQISPVEWGLLPLLFLALATSVDALMAGVGLGPLPMSYLSALVVGAITFALCALAYALSSFFKKLAPRWPLRFASLIFFFLGGRVLFDYFF